MTLRVFADSLSIGMLFIATRLSVHMNGCGKYFASYVGALVGSVAKCIPVIRDPPTHCPYSPNSKFFRRWSDPHVRSSGVCKRHGPWEGHRVWILGGIRHFTRIVFRGFNRRVE